MSRNDRHIAYDGSMRSELQPEYEELLEHRDSLDAKINAKLMEMPMLKGKGFLVVAPSQPRFDGEEFEKVEDAEERAAEVAHQFGTAIIYAPIAVIKPKREMVTKVPSQLLEQIGRTQAGLPAGGPVATVEPTK